MFKLIDLPYKSLAPVISDETLSFHHGKHLQGAVDHLNNLIAGTEYEKMSLEEIVKKSSGAVFNNAGQILNHNLYFTQFTPSHSERSEESEESPLFVQIAKQWGSVDAFKADFEAKGVTLFGSGWVWLSADASGKLVITQEGNAQNPLTKGLKPLLTFDVWEHAYYIDYRNRRPDYLKGLWQIVDWDVVNNRLG